ncbi:MAG: disulfide bond formation protein B [Ostreibacterium sp.]
MLFSRRGCNFLAAIGCFALIALAYFYFEKTLYLTPCPLCYAQRIVFAILGFFFLIAAIFPGGRLIGKFYGIILLLTASGGVALSIRHLLLQFQPKSDSLATCGQDFYALVENTPFAQVVQNMITGNSDCGEVQWGFLGLSMPGWTLVAFIGFGLWGFFHNVFRQY